MTDKKRIPPLDDLLGRRIMIDGYEWTLRYSRVKKRLVLERPNEPGAVEQMLQSVREGGAILRIEPDAIERSELPQTREDALLEIALFEAALEGRRRARPLSAALQQALLRRLEAVRARLARWF
jgi:hypothetical protein